MMQIALSVSAPQHRAHPPPLLCLQGEWQIHRLQKEEISETVTEAVIYNLEAVDVDK